jgi:hypothetical protein
MGRLATPDSLLELQASIVLAGHNKRVQLIGISTVAGNQTVEKVTENALAVLAAAGLHSIGKDSFLHIFSWPVLCWANKISETSNVRPSAAADVVMGQHRPLMRPAVSWSASAALPSSALVC